MQKGDKVIHKNHRDWGIEIVDKPPKNPKKVFVAFIDSVQVFWLKPCTITNLEII